jgi:hypothetical protein
MNNRIGTTAAIDCSVNAAPSHEDLLAEVPSETLLKILYNRGGHPGALAEAALLCAKKSADYNQGMGHLDIHNVDRSSYFPFGEISYAQMLHTKTQRFNSLVKKGLAGEVPNFEGLRDTALDIINYAGFFIADDQANGRP